MPELSAPTPLVHASFLAAMAEFQAEGRGSEGDYSMIGGEIRSYGPHWSAPEGFAVYLRWLADQAIEESPRPEHHVPSTTLWWIEADNYLGRIAIRHRLNDSLIQVGGHIGYDVRPSARQRGHASAMLAAALPLAHALGIDSALVTCDVSNPASRRVIERNGGVLENQRGSTLRFWVSTH